MRVHQVMKDWRLMDVLHRDSNDARFWNEESFSWVLVNAVKNVATNHDS